ncbi:MAG: hypothetical protein KAR15_16495, partial [Desulfobacterales bacterium]|nr:hypothetical protein [Desulfobacterales bacterium]
SPAKVTIKALDPVNPKSLADSSSHRLIRKTVKNMMRQSLTEMALDPAGNTDVAGSGCSL